MRSYPSEIRSTGTTIAARSAPAAHGDRLAPGLHRLIGRQPGCPVVANSGYHAWLVTGYTATRRVLEDPHLSLVRTSRPGVPHQGFARVPLAITGFRGLTTQAGLRPELLRALGPARTEVPAAWLRATARHLLTELRRHGPPADLWTQFAVPFATRTACRLLGIPPQDGPFLAAYMYRDPVLNTPSALRELRLPTGEGPLRGAAGADDRLLHRMRETTPRSTGLLHRLTALNQQRRRLGDRRLSAVLGMLLQLILVNRTPRATTLPSSLTPTASIRAVPCERSPPSATGTTAAPATT